MSRRVAIGPLAIACRSLSTLLASGVSIRKALRVAGSRAADRRVRRVFGELDLAVARGEEVSDAIAADGSFPPLATELMAVGDRTGNLPEVCARLADHYENLVRLRREFLRAIAFPVFQLVAAILVIALLILILGWIAQSQGGVPFDVLGFGLSGEKGALTWLGLTSGTAAVGFVVFKIARATPGGREALDPLLVHVPVLGGCLRAFAVSRFSWTLSLTMNSGVPIDRSLDSAFRATSNGAYARTRGEVIASVLAGEDLADALGRTGLFATDYLHMVEVGDHSGMVPETLDRIAPELEADGRRKLDALVAAAGWAIWAVIAGFIIFVIFRIFGFYIGMLNEAANF
ncbi:MAG: type II secretion system F family protein [Planctomycetota bacterium]